MEETEANCNAVVQIARQALRFKKKSNSINNGPISTWPHERSSLVVLGKGQKMY